MAHESQKGIDEDNLKKENEISFLNGVYHKTNAMLDVFNDERDENKTPRYAGIIRNIRESVTKRTQVLDAVTGEYIHDDEAEASAVRDIANTLDEWENDPNSKVDPSKLNDKENKKLKFFLGLLGGSHKMVQNRRQELGIDMLMSGEESNRRLAEERAFLNDVYHQTNSMIDLFNDRRDPAKLPAFANVVPELRDIITKRSQALDKADSNYVHDIASEQAAVRRLYNALEKWRNGAVRENDWADMSEDEKKKRDAFYALMDGAYTTIAQRSKALGMNLFPETVVAQTEGKFKRWLRNSNLIPFITGGSLGFGVRMATRATLAAWGLNSVLTCAAGAATVLAASPLLAGVLGAAAGGAVIGIPAATLYKYLERKEAGWGKIGSGVSKAVRYGGVALTALAVFAGAIGGALIASLPVAATVLTGIVTASIFGGVGGAATSIVQTGAYNRSVNKSGEGKKRNYVLQALKGFGLGALGGAFVGGIMDYLGIASASTGPGKPGDAMGDNATDNGTTQGQKPVVPQDGNATDDNTTQGQKPVIPQDGNATDDNATQGQKPVIPQDGNATDDNGTAQGQEPGKGAAQKPEPEDPNRPAQNNPDQKTVQDKPEQKTVQDNPEQEKTVHDKQKTGRTNKYDSLKQHTPAGGEKDLTPWWDRKADVLRADPGVKEVDPVIKEMVERQTQGASTVVVGNGQAYTIVPNADGTASAPTGHVDAQSNNIVNAPVEQPEASGIEQHVPQSRTGRVRAFIVNKLHK